MGDLASKQWHWIAADRWEAGQLSQLSSGAVLDRLTSLVKSIAIDEGLTPLPLVAMLVGGDQANFYKSYMEDGRVLVVCVRPGSTPLLDKDSPEFDLEFAHIAASVSAQKEAGIFVLPA